MTDMKSKNSNTEYLRSDLSMGKYIFIPPRDNLIFPPTKYGMESPRYLNYLVAGRVWILAGFRQKLNRRSHMRLSFPRSPHWGPAAALKCDSAFVKFLDGSFIIFLFLRTAIFLDNSRPICEGSRFSLQEQRFHSAENQRCSVKRRRRGHRFLRSVHTSDGACRQVLTMPAAVEDERWCNSSGFLAAMLGDLWNSPAAFPFPEFGRKPA